jgi:hypothetical protein
VCILRSWYQEPGENGTKDIGWGWSKRGKRTVETREGTDISWLLWVVRWVVGGFQIISSQDSGGLTAGGRAQAQAKGLVLPGRPLGLQMGIQQLPATSLLVSARCVSIHQTKLLFSLPDCLLYCHCNTTYYAILSPNRPTSHTLHTIALSLCAHQSSH